MYISEQEREPLPLALHHYPISITFALFDMDGTPESLTLAIDPTEKEEIASNGKLTLTLNAFEEVNQEDDREWRDLAALNLEQHEETRNELLLF